MPEIFYYKSVERRRELEDRRYVILENFLSPALLHGLRARVEALFESEGQNAGSKFRQEAGTRRLANHAAFGPKQLMWATDWPIVEQHHTTYAQALTLVKNDMKFLNDEDKSWMLSKTIERVWPFD